MQVVWKFYCGLTSFEEGCPKFCEILKSVDQSSDNLFGVQCAFEFFVTQEIKARLVQCVFRDEHRFVSIVVIITSEWRTISL